MSKLTSLKPTVQRLGSNIGKLDDIQKEARLDWRKWYSLARWKKLRQAILLRDGYTCKMCGKVAVHGMVIDHTVPHKGDERLFFEPANLAVLCKSPCHDKHKQAMEVAGRW